MTEEKIKEKWAEMEFVNAQSSHELFVANYQLKDADKEEYVSKLVLRALGKKY